MLLRTDVGELRQGKYTTHDKLTRVNNTPPTFYPTFTWMTETKTAFGVNEDWCRWPNHLITYRKEKHSQGQLESAGFRGSLRLKAKPFLSRRYYFKVVGTVRQFFSVSSIDQEAKRLKDLECADSVHSLFKDLNWESMVKGRPHTTPQRRQQCMNVHVISVSKEIRYLCLIQCVFFVLLLKRSTKAKLMIIFDDTI